MRRKRVFIWGVVGLIVTASICLMVYAVILDRAFRQYVGPQPPPVKSTLNDEQLVLLGRSVSDVRWAIDNELAVRTPRGMQEILSEMQADRGSSFFRNPIDGNPILVNPDLTAWSGAVDDPRFLHTALVITWIGNGPLSRSWVYVHFDSGRCYLGPDNPERSAIDMDWVSALLRK